ncbi:patatin-like phospholipase family protein [Azohydromonas aeria]|uniref:patatin-like phospholipase family protein n=1 Tax=Azohydromonas aeria TaxID=2590212 RepID=UPI001E48D761|nr:patatin-like phospholipase family protein [Azohydromonas aeria]
MLPSRSKPLPRERRVPIDLALQGGGAHGAFTWGVLDRLLQEPGLELAGISGTSAGAVNAVALASGLAQDGREGARAALRRLWTGIADIGGWHGWVRAAALPGAATAPWIAPVQHWCEAWQDVWRDAWAPALGQTVSPYLSNPLNLNPLRDLLERVIDFDCVRRSGGPRLFIATTHVRSGHLRIFRQHEISVDVVLASACLPLLFQAVEIDGQAYWDGGFAGNPSLLPLIMESPADDLLLVQLNPRQCESVPTTARRIVDRMNEITFNASLLKELRAIGLMKQIIEDEGRCARRVRSPLYRRIQALRVHRIDSQDRLPRLGASSKLDTRWRFLSRLHGIGVDAASQWLGQHRDDLGRRSSMDLATEFDA